MLFTQASFLRRWLPVEASGVAASGVAAGGVAAGGATKGVSNSTERLRGIDWISVRAYVGAVPFGKVLGQMVQCRLRKVTGVAKGRRVGAR